MLRVVCMMCNLYFDGKPGDGKLSCPVWGGGKGGDKIKALPIVIKMEQPDCGCCCILHWGSSWQCDTECYHRILFINRD